MDKKIYNKPELTVVKLTAMSHLLAGSPYESGAGEAGSGTNTNTNNPFSTFDGEEIPVK